MQTTQHCKYQNNFLTLNHFSEELLQVTIDFLNSKNLLLNANKTNYLLFYLKNFHFNDASNFEISIENSILERKKSSTFLGLIIDDQLTWNDHVDHVCNKISSGVYAIRKMSFYCELSTLLLLYYAHIHSHIQFGLIIYGGTSQSNLTKILIMQKKAIRAMLKITQNSSCRNKFKDLKILTVIIIYIYIKQFCT